MPAPVVSGTFIPQENPGAKSALAETIPGFA